ncbi:MAG TPA: phosphatase PAP2 family protein [Anaeromyxobacteraceae bacterium]|nr:phosphatase PAP2 family protein [Anaeromyxobacteraceae bacterium]
MRPLALAAALLAACASTSAARRPEPTPAPPDAAALAEAAAAAAAVVGSCPEKESDTWRSDLAIALWLQEARTPEEVRRAEAEVNLTPEALSEAAGAPLDAAHRPLTLALLGDAARRARAVYGAIKERCARPRPYDFDPRLQPAVERERSFAFPSGHATIGALFARLLAELAPARAAALTEGGRQIGFDRVRAGVHWASDVAAGQRLGVALAEEWLAEPAFRGEVEKVRREEWK